MPTPRIDEIADRLAEIRLAFPGLAERSPDALRFLAAELDDLLAECVEWDHRWRQLRESAELLVREVGDARAHRPQAHTED